MQTLNCENCKLLFTDALQDDLSSDSKVFFAEHITECKECAALYKDFEKLSDIIKSTPIPHIPAGFHFNTVETIAKGKRIKKQKMRRQWLSVAAVFFVFLGSSIVFQQEALKTKEHYAPMSMENDAASPSAELYDATEYQERVGSGPLYSEIFQEALLQPDFAEEIERANLGFGYELLEYTQEEDGSVTFMIYFYTDNTYTLKTEGESVDFLTLSNVRSFHWKKNE